MLPNHLLSQELPPKFSGNESTYELNILKVKCSLFLTLARSSFFIVEKPFNSFKADAVKSL